MKRRPGIGPGHDRVGPCHRPRPEEPPCRDRFRASPFSARPQICFDQARRPCSSRTRTTWLSSMRGGTTKASQSEMTLRRSETTARGNPGVPPPGSAVVLWERRTRVRATLCSDNQHLSILAFGSTRTFRRTLRSGRANGSKTGDMNANNTEIGECRTHRAVSIDNTGPGGRRE